ncbi:Nn.00g020180.m01.CDS01 [Neocucurbitaria sp. VM-36]
MPHYRYQRMAEVPLPAGTRIKCVICAKALHVTKGANSKSLKMDVLVVKCGHAVHAMCAKDLFLESAQMSCPSTQCNATIEQPPQVVIRLDEANARTRECSICFEVNSSVLFGCSHNFHEACIKSAWHTWVTAYDVKLSNLDSWRNWPCPNCRSPIDTAKLFAIQPFHPLELAYLAREKTIGAEFRALGPQFAPFKEKAEEHNGEMNNTMFTEAIKNNPKTKVAIRYIKLQYKVPGYTYNYVIVATVKDTIADLGKLWFRHLIPGAEIRMSGQRRRFSHSAKLLAWSDTVEGVPIRNGATLLHNVSE